jgi:putative transposase
MLTVIDEYTRECLAIAVARRLTSDDVLRVLTDLFVERAPPGHIRSDNVLCREAAGARGRKSPPPV